MQYDHSGVDWCGVCDPFSVLAEVARYRHVGGGTDKGGTTVTMPIVLQQALTIEGIAQRYGVLPSAVVNEDARVLRYIEIVEEYRGG